MPALVRPQVKVRGSLLRVKVPADYSLSRDVCSYGYFLLRPNHWIVDQQCLLTCLHLEDGAAGCKLSQPGNKGSELSVRFDRKLTKPEQVEARAQLARMLRLDESRAEVAAFHKVDARWKRSGRGRLFRSPTLFEDVVKTVTSCNVAWPSTINMNRRLCEVCGKQSPSGLFSFPTAKRIARMRAGTLRARCRVGYRDQRLVELAKLFVRGEVDEAWLTSSGTSDDEAFGFLLGLPGIGPYAAGNIMMLLGRYSRLALDTESIRHGKTVLGLTGTDRAILKRLDKHYEPFGGHRFRSYWFEIWEWYQEARGPAHLWDRDEVGASFTASKF